MITPTTTKAKIQFTTLLRGPSRYKAALSRQLFCSVSDIIIPGYDSPVTRYSHNYDVSKGTFGFLLLIRGRLA